MADNNFEEEDLFADLYDGDDSSKPAAAATGPPEKNMFDEDPEDEGPPPAPVTATEPTKQETVGDSGDAHMGGSAWNGNSNGNGNNNAGPSFGTPAADNDDNYGPINVKEDGKMFIGGLNWETTEQSLKDYFSQFGEVSECTVMRDSATGRSRGFGFLTFKDPKCVNIVMVKEHYLDGKIIDPKRAIPREEQERTSKIFVGGVSQEATEEDFKSFFKQFGRVVDATLMMDKDTGRPRGFGFVTFDGDAAVDATLAGPLQILGKPIEVKRAQPRGNMREGEDDKKFGGRGNKFGNRQDNMGGNFDNQQNQQQQGGGGPNQMTPAMMAQYWQRMQSYFQQMQQSIAAAQNPMAGGMAPNMANMQQMMAMQGGMRGGTGSPHPQSPSNMGGMNPQMNPQMMQQMQQMQQMQMQQQQAGGGGFGQNPAMMGPNRPAYNAQEQLAFEQQKYEQQQARRMQQAAGYGTPQGGPTSWEGMYDDAPQPTMPPQGPGGGRGNNFGGFGGGRGGGGRNRQGSSQPPSGPSNAPANAPTGPKNAGVPGANYRGGGRMNQGSNRHNPYGHKGRG